jgi:MFS family permease
VVTGYLVTQAVLLPIAGRAGDLYGRRRVWVAGILIMVLASALCAVAWSEPALIVFRIMQGVGASAMAVAPTVLFIASALRSRRAGPASPDTTAAPAAGQRKNRS